VIVHDNDSNHLKVPMDSLRRMAQGYDWRLAHSYTTVPVIGTPAAIGLRNIWYALPAVPLSVLVADDHNFVRGAIKSLLETDPDVRVVAEAATLHEAMQRTAEFKPDAVVLDLHMGDKFDPPEVKAAFASTRLIAISAWEDEENGILAENYGTTILLDKISLAQSLIPAIKGQESG
jgi:CheY-like chemotaxis protein